MSFMDNSPPQQFNSAENVAFQQPTQVNMPAAPPSNPQGFMNMGYNPMMSQMPNMGYNYQFQPQASYMPQYPQMMPQVPQMFGTPPQAPGMGMMPPAQPQFPTEPTMANLNNSFDSSLDRSPDPILVDNGM